MSVAPTHQGADRMQRKKEKKGGGKEGKDREVEIKRGLEEGCGGRGEKGEEKRSEEEENTWIYLKTRLYTRVRPIQKVGASKLREERKKDQKSDVEGTMKKRIPQGHNTGNKKRQRE